MDLEHVRYLNSLAEDLKTSIFNRTSFALVIIGVIFTIAGGNFLFKWESFNQSGLKTLMALEILMTLLFGFIAAYNSIIIILPLPDYWSISNVIKKQKRSEDVRFSFYSKFTMFNQVVSLGRSEFVETITNASNEELCNDLLHSLYDLNHVVEHKFRKLHTVGLLLILMLGSFTLFMFTLLVDKIFLI